VLLTPEPRVTSPEHSYDPSAPDGDIPRRVTKGGSHVCAPSYCLRYRLAAHQGEGDTTISRIGFAALSAEREACAAPIAIRCRAGSR
jgi:formylglycine-generating enzyme